LLDSSSELVVVHCYTGDMRLPARVQEAMQMQVEAERKKRAAILESEGLSFFAFIQCVTVSMAAQINN